MHTATLLKKVPQGGMYCQGNPFDRSNYFKYDIFWLYLSQGMFFRV
jgi:hypothetical protein